MVQHKNYVLFGPCCVYVPIDFTHTHQDYFSGTEAMYIVIALSLEGVKTKKYQSFWIVIWAPCQRRANADLLCSDAPPVTRYIMGLSHEIQFKTHVFKRPIFFPIVMCFSTTYVRSCCESTPFEWFIMISVLYELIMYYEVVGGLLFILTCIHTPKRPLSRKPSYKRFKQHFKSCEINLL